MYFEETETLKLHDENQNQQTCKQKKHTHKFLYCIVERKSKRRKNKTKKNH